MKTLLRAGAIALALFAGMPAAADSPLVGRVISGPASPPAGVMYCDDGTGHTALCIFDTVVKGTATDRGASIGTSATQLMAANTARRGFAIQNQSASADCYISGQATATADYHNLKIAAGAYYETPAGHVGTGAISIICTAASTSVYAREW